LDVARTRPAHFFIALATGCSTAEASDGPLVEMVRAVDLNPAPNVVEVSLVAERALVQYANGKNTAVWAYRDAASSRPATVPGPLIEASIGDRLVVHFENRLDDATTVHFHGPRVPNEMDGAPMGESLVLPRGRFVYEFQVVDAGTFWYHPHWRTDIQIERGLYGQLVVHGERIPNTPERFFMLDDVDLHTDGTLDEALTDTDRLLGRHGEIILVNGRTSPAIEVSPGARERWHFTNASNGRYFELELPGHRFTVVGTDGGVIERAYDVETLRIAPGKRYDVFVKLIGDSGDEFTLNTLPVARGTAYDDRVRSVLTLRFGAQSAAQAPSDERLPGHDLEPIPVDELTPVERFELELESDPFVGEEPRFSINDQYFPFADDVPGEIGAVRVWELANLTPSPEPFHLHGTFMQALSLDDVPIDRLAAEDVIDVPAGSTMRVAVHYEQPGHWMFHSNIPEHAEAGMMRVLRLH
jgi:FtsP/CotA-like multicopper oxidase with cupredoxin domain